MQHRTPGRAACRTFAFGNADFVAALTGTMIRAELSGFS